MKKKTGPVLLGILIASAVPVIGYIGVYIWASGYPLIDPPPKGEGSFEELDTVSTQFRNYFQTRIPDDLPTGFVRVESDDPNAETTWMIYYATASHPKKRGGTIVLMGSDGRIDGYYGHHCSSVDGGPVILSATGYSIWHGGEYFDSFEQVRDAFGAYFKHQRTEQAAPSNGG